MPRPCPSQAIGHPLSSRLNSSELAAAAEPSLCGLWSHELPRSCASIAKSSLTSIWFEVPMFESLCGKPCDYVWSLSLERVAAIVRIPVATAPNVCACAAKVCLFLASLHVRLVF